MYNIASRLVNNKMDTEDILQDSFITAFSRLGDLKDRNAFGGWLKRIVINNCISLQRKRKFEFENIEDYKFEDGSGSDESMPDIDPALVHNAIKELPDKGRAVLVLRALEGYKHQEIAEILGISVSTSKTQYSRALALLNRKLKSKIDVD